MPNIFDEAEEKAEFRAALEDGTLGHQHVADEWLVSEASVRRYRARKGISLQKGSPAPQQQPKTTVASAGRVDIDKDGATINNVVVESPILDDWGPIFALFNLDSSKFEVVDDTVRMSTWQQSARDEAGDRDTIQLYAYSARFRRISADFVAPETVQRWREALYVNEIPPVTPSEGGTYTILVSDPQLGKKGTAEAVENWRNGVLGHLEAARALQGAGTALQGLHVAFQGDETEGVCNNYANQPYLVEMNLARQLELDYDLRVWTLREAAKLGLSLSASSVISNHGEWTRNGSKDVVTTRDDNASTHIARQVEKFFREMASFGGPQVAWTIGDSAPGVQVRLSGVDSYFSHGYIEKGRGSATEIRTKNAIERQILGRTDTLGSTWLWFMAHYHHFYMQEFEGRTLFGCPALEKERSSEYMLDQYGVWSPAGMLGLVVGDTYKRGWSHLSVQ